MNFNILQKEKKEKYEVFFSLVLKDKPFIEFTDTENFSLKQSIEHSYIIGNENYSLFIYNADIMKEKNSNTYETKIKINSADYKIKMNIKSEISFVFKPDVEKLIFFKNESIDQSKISYRLKFIRFYEDLIQENKDKENAIKKLISEGINTFEGDNSFEYFILLFSKCFKQNNIFKLLSLFPKDFKIINYNDEDYKNLNELKNTIEEIYKTKNEILNLLKEEDENEKEKEKEKKQKKKKNSMKKLKIFFIFL